MLSIDIAGTRYTLKNPRSCSREIHTSTKKTSQAFGLPIIEVNTVEMESFIGDVTRGGSCNVRTLSFTPHNLTHVETPAHIEADGKTILDIDKEIFSGITVVIDLTEEQLKHGYIYPKHIKEIDRYPEASILAIKTNVSEMDMHTNFTGTDPIALHPSTTELISQQYPHIRLLILDLPSADREDDDGLLAAHKNFFNFLEEPKGMDKAIVELAYLKNIHHTGYYFSILTPARVDLDAIITDIVFYDVGK